MSRTRSVDDLGSHRFQITQAVVFGHRAFAIATFLPAVARSSGTGERRPKATRVPTMLLAVDIWDSYKVSLNLWANDSSQRREPSPRRLVDVRSLAMEKARGLIGTSKGSLTETRRKAEPLGSVAASNILAIPN